MHNSTIYICIHTKYFQTNTLQFSNAEKRQEITVIMSILYCTILFLVFYLYLYYLIELCRIGRNCCERIANIAQSSKTVRARFTTTRQTNFYRARRRRISVIGRPKTENFFLGKQFRSIDKSSQTGTVNIYSSFVLQSVKAKSFPLDFLLFFIY